MVFMDGRTMLTARIFFTIIFLMLGIKTTISLNKYSAELNQKVDFNSAEKPFRMNKVNLLWEKAQKRLGPEKLKSLYSDLKLQDKEEMSLKRLRAEGGDKDGLKEAALRRRFKALVDRYDLGEHLEHIEETLRQKSASVTSNDAVEEGIQIDFKDHKLKKLWKIAEKSGFSKEELKVLQEELSHHQEKLDEYHQLMDELSKTPDSDAFDNSLNQIEENSVINVTDKLKSFKENSQLLKEKYRDLKKSYEKLNKLTKDASDNNEFEEFRVQELWKLAKRANFNEDELESLKDELHHYEHRIKKLKHLENQVDFNVIDNEKWIPEHKVEERKHLEQRIKQYSHKVGKIHNDLESRIMQRHLEL